jgi:methionyl-tRNA formyltransferase
MNAVVFAYHNVGVRCLKVLLARGVQVSLVVTHEDSATENIWFGSVAGLCREHGIPASRPPTRVRRNCWRSCRPQPDFIFSFYYRHMLPVEVLACARRGAYNMHGSLLPKYRGRVPINWAVLHGETETGATLHEMTVKPDAGAIVAQTSVPILPDDTAHEVFGKVVVAAEQTLWRVLPAMLAGQTPNLPNDLSQGSYFSGRKPEDGRIDWRRTAGEVHNLVRAVAPPYPGAFRKSRVILRSREPGWFRQRPTLPCSGPMVRKTSSSKAASCTPVVAMATSCRSWGSRSMIRMLPSTII